MGNTRQLYITLSSLLAILKDGPCTKTSLAKRANLKSRESERYINLLHLLNWVTREGNNFKITDKGRNFLREYGSFMQFIPNFPVVYPTKFVDTLDERKHTLLLYEEPEYGKLIKFRFINNGLLRGEHGIILTHDEGVESIEYDMISFGIDVHGFKLKNLLHIYKISNPADDPDGALSGAKKIWSRISTNLQSPFRVVGRFLPEVNTVQQVETEMVLERYWREGFSNFRSSLMCTYHVEEIEATRRGEWLSSLLQYHHATIFATKLGGGMAFDMR